MSHENTPMLLTGDVTVFRKNDDGSEAAGLGPLSATLLQQQANSETIDLADRRRGRRGQLISSVNDPQPPTGQLTVSTVPGRLLAALFLGTEHDIDESGGSVSNEEVTADLDYWSDLAQRNVANVVVTGTGGTPTYVEGTDYEVNYRRGMIRPLVGGDISDGASLEVDYDHYAVTGQSVHLATKSQVKARLVLDGVNEAVDPNQDIEWEAYRAILTPAEAIDFMASEHISAAFNLKFETPDGYDHPTRLDFPVRATS